MKWLCRRSRETLSQPTLYSIGGIATIFQPSKQAQAELWSLLNEQPPVELGGDGTVVVHAHDGDGLLEDLESRSQSLIAGSIARLTDDEMEELVAGILRAMGYYTQLAPASGGDGGIDVLAARDPVFVEPPIIKVQVKQRGSRAAPSDIRALAGILTPDDRGVFVSMGGFSPQAKGKLESARITLLDAARLQELLLQHYDKLDQDTKALVPLRRLYFPQQ
jgi:restriction system protein